MLLDNNIGNTQVRLSIKLVHSHECNGPPLNEHCIDCCGLTPSHVIITPDTFAVVMQAIASVVE